MTKTGEEAKRLMPDEPTPTEDRRSRPSPWAHPVDERRRQARARRAHRRRILLGLLAVVLAAGAGYGYYLLRGERVEQAAEKYLEDLLGTHVSIEPASYVFGHGILLEQLAVRAPAPFTETILEADQVRLKVDTLSVLLGSPEVTEIVVVRPTITLVHRDREAWNFQALIRSRPTEATPPAIRPVISLQDGTLRVVRKVEGEAVYTHTVGLSGLLLPSEADRHTYHFQTDIRKAAEAGAAHEPLGVASGTLDVRRGTLEFKGQASNVALDKNLYDSLPGEVQEIWRRFDPDGPGTPADAGRDARDLKGTINAKLVFDEKKVFRLEAELTGVSFSYPYGGLTHRFENLTGRCTFDRSVLALANVHGLMNGWPITLSGTVSGFEDEHLVLDLAASADHVDVGRSRELLLNLSPHLERLYAHYRPEGRADVRLALSRPRGPDGRLNVSGTLTCRDMAMTYHLFPYRLEGLRGTVAFSPDEYKVENMKGRHGEAEVTLTGRALHPGPGAEVRFHVTATGVPLDEDLRNALRERQRRAYDLYDPRGTADAEVDIVRPGLEGARPRVTVDLALRDAAFTYEKFPYPVTNATGRIRIAPEGTEIREVRGRHGDAVVTLDGELVGPADAPSRLTLRIAGTDVALDEDLKQALPERQRQTLEKFHLTGLADFEGTLTRGPETDDRLDYDLTIRLKGARMIYEPFPFMAEDMTGTVRLTRDSCRIESLEGVNSGASIAAEGWIEQRPDDYAMDLMLTGTDVVLDASLRGALGPDIRAAWSRLSPTGRVDVRAHLRKAFGPDETVDHHVWVTLRDARARLDVFPYPLEHVNGKLEFIGEEVLLDLTARTGLTAFALEGDVGYDAHGPRLNLAIRADGMRFEGPLRDALPAPLKKAFDILKPTGRIDLDLVSLRYGRDEDGTGRAEWYGKAVLDEVGAEPGVAIEGVVGKIEDVVGTWTEGRTTFQGTMRIQQGEVAEKDFRNTSVDLRKTAGADAVSLHGIEGEFYGGRMEGSATIGLTAGGSYAIDLAVTEVDFERLLREGFRLEHNIHGGRLRGTMGLRAVGERAEASGFLRVTDAELYELPLVVRLINVFRLAASERTAFQKARVLYFLRGGRLILGDIRLEGRALNLYGAGVMEADGRLYLTFMTGKKNDDPLLPALSELMEGVRKQIVVVLVTGTLAEPEVEFRTLSAVTAPIREVVELVREQRGGRADRQ
jgi:hypothetical protein